MDETLSSSLYCSNHCMNFLNATFHLDPLNELGYMLLIFLEGCWRSINYLFWWSIKVSLNINLLILHFLSKLISSQNSNFEFSNYEDVEIIVINVIPYQPVPAKKRYTLISDIVPVKYRSVPACTAKYWAIPVFWVKYHLVYAYLNKISNFYTLIFFIFWNSKRYGLGILIRKSSTFRCSEKIVP